MMRSIRRAVLIALVAALALWGRSLAIFSRGSIATAPPTSLERSILHVEPGCKLEVLREVPEEVWSLLVAPGPNPRVYVGTRPIGAVYSFDAWQPSSYSVVAEGLGDHIRFGLCEVNTMAIRDLDRDGTPELLATTSQIVPRGRPRLYAWSLSSPPVLRGMVRPDIRSSWSHGLGFLEAPGAPSLSTYVTFCGFGEVVEYQLDRVANESGYAAEALRWKQVGQLAVSGEWIESNDVDQDGQDELCVATGFATGRAAIHIYAAGRPGDDLRLEQAIDESGRFHNVRFLVGDTRGDGQRDLVAWWRGEHPHEPSEMVRYRLGPEGVRERTVLARGTVASLWPVDGQMALLDLDGDGRPEVWFANDAGLCRFDPSRTPALARIVQIQGRIAPIAPLPATSTTPPALLVGWGRSVLRLVADDTASAPSSVAAASVSRQHDRRGRVAHDESNR